MFTFESNSKKFLLIAVAFNIFAAGAFGLIFFQVKGKNEHVSNLINEIDRAVTQEQTLSSIKALVQETEKNRAKLADYFIGKEGVVSFIEELEALGSRTGVEVTIDAVEEKVSAGSTQTEELRLTLHFGGTWSSVVQYIGLLELLPIEGRLERVAVSSNTETSGWRGDTVLLALRLQ